MHPSIIQTGSQLKSTTGKGLELGCPLCPKFTTTRAKTICRHLESHIKNAVNFEGELMTRGNECVRHWQHCIYKSKVSRLLFGVSGSTWKEYDFLKWWHHFSEWNLLHRYINDCNMWISLAGTNICRCNQACRHTGHYHCPHCDRTIVRKEDMTFHVIGCQKACNMVPPSAEVSSSSSSFVTPSASQQGSAQPPAEHRSPRSAGDHCYAFSPCCQPPSPPPSEASEPPAEASSKKEADAAQLPSSRVIYLKLVKCPHCSVVLYKKNLLVHIQRKHAKEKDITAASHSKSKCAAAACGLFDIPKGIHVWLGGLSCLSHGNFLWCFQSLNLNFLVICLNS